MEGWADWVGLPWCKKRLIESRGIKRLTAVFERQQRMVGGQGLGRGDVQPSRGDLTAGQSLVQVLLVHHTPSGSNAHRPKGAKVRTGIQDREQTN